MWYVLTNMSCTPAAAGARWSTCLSAAFVPTGTKPGVSMTPCGVWIRPTCGATVLCALQCRLRTAHRSGPYA